jgi:hypothetical protein
VTEGYEYADDDGRCPECRAEWYKYSLSCWSCDYDPAHEEFNDAAMAEAEARFWDQEWDLYGDQEPIDGEPEGRRYRVIKYSETRVVWSSKTGSIALHRLKNDNYEYFKDLTYSGGATWVEVRSMTGSTLVARMLSDMWIMVLRYDLDAEDVHRAFCHVEEYALMVADSVPEDLHPLQDDEAVLIVPGEPPIYFRLNAGRKERIA